MYLTVMIFMSLLTSAQGTINFTYEKVNEHIDSLRDLQNRKVETNQALALLGDLREIENYGQSLAHYFLEAYQSQVLQPYTLNLLQEYFYAQIKVHGEILDLREGNHNNEILKALQIESFRKIHDLFFHRKSLRTLLTDQLNIPTLSLGRWYELKDRTLSTRNISKRESYLERNFFPIENEVNRDNTLIQAWRNSGLYQLSQKDESWKSLANTELFWRNIGDGVLAGLGKIPTGASAAFGAVAGSIAWREGYLKDNKDLLNKLEETLLPFDLLMEKKAYKFTDITIPGHWGHVGIYLGSEEQLKALGLWDNPVLKPFRENIRAGKRIFQVRRWGLEFDSLQGFMNLDEMAVLRVEDFHKRSSKDLEMTLKYLGEQIGKGYDFNFDAMTGETITCTEIIAFSFGPIKWPMEVLLGRLTISPNNLAELAFHTGAPLKTIHYITGDQGGMHFLSEADLGKTLGYVLKNQTYQKHSVSCKREMYRHRRDGLRFHYSCEDEYNEFVY